MTKYTAFVATNVRVYGRVEIEAGSFEEAMTQIREDYPNIDLLVGDTDWSNLTDASVLEIANDETGELWEPDGESMQLDKES